MEGKKEAKKEANKQSKDSLKAIVLDSPRILNDFSFSFREKGYYTTNKVIQELIDFRSRLIADQGIQQSFLTIRDPAKSTVQEVIAKSKKINSVLSETDYSVIALALELKREGLNAVIETDDYSLQNLALHLRIEFSPVEREGIKEKKSFKKPSKKKL